MSRIGEQERSRMKDYICNMISTIACCRKWRGFFAWSLLLIPLLIDQGCKSSNKEAQEQTETSPVNDTLPHDFVYFFDRFHADSNYQKEHISFPLEGLPNSSGDTLANSSQRYYWQKEGWQIHRPFTDPSHQFDQWFEILNDRVIEHWIRMNGTNLFMHRRFAKLDNEWYLIYYAGMRPNSEKMKAKEEAEAKE
jgi:hypothetical protein